MLDLGHFGDSRTDQAALEKMLCERRPRELGFGNCLFTNFFQGAYDAREPPFAF